HSLRAEKVVVPDREQTDEHRKVALKRRGAEVLIHFVKTIEQRAEIIRPDSQHGRKADRRVHRVTPAYPIPKAEHIRSVDSELGNLCGIGRDRDEVFGYRFGIAAEAL